MEATGNVGVSGKCGDRKVTSPDQDKSGELVAVTKSGNRVLKAASARILGDIPLAGGSLAEPTTAISFNMQERLYYKVTETAAREPATHKEAIEGGWKRYLWTDDQLAGSGVEQGLCTE